MNGPYTRHRSAPCVQWSTVMPLTSALVRQAASPEVARRRHALAQRIGEFLRKVSEGRSPNIAL